MPPLATLIVEPFQIPCLTVPVVSTAKPLPAPLTEKIQLGEVEAMPTLPADNTVKVEVACQFWPVCQVRV